MQIAVVGCGPAGLYTARKLLEKIPSIKLALFENQTLPYGLVRTGVSPDHPELRALKAKFLDTLLDNRITYLGPECSFDWSQGRKYFDGVIDARGGSVPNQITGLNYNFQNVWDSKQFVEWILGFHSNDTLAVALRKSKKIAIIGMGNVALDVSRFLVSKPSDYACLEVGDEAIRYLYHNCVEQIQIFGRKKSSLVLRLLILICRFLLD